MNSGDKPFGNSIPAPSRKARHRALSLGGVCAPAGLADDCPLALAGVGALSAGTEVTADGCKLRRTSAAVDGCRSAAHVNSGAVRGPGRCIISVGSLQRDASLGRFFAPTRPVNNCPLAGAPT